jgi:hypothetical protein
MLYLITLANNTFQYEFVMLYTLAKELGWTVIVAGQNEPWKGWRTKMDVYARACKDIAANEPDAIVVCSDAYDVLPLRAASEFSMSFDFSKRPIVVSAETFCGSNCRPLNNFGTSSRPYVNAGLICGRAQFVANMWSSLLATQWTDDQMALSEYMDNHVELFHLDSDANILFTRPGGVEKDVVSNDVIDGFGPWFLHLPGLQHHQDQKDMYAVVLRAVATRTNLNHILSTQWASRHVPFQGDLIFYSLISALILACACVVVLWFRVK